MSSTLRKLVGLLFAAFALLATVIGIILLLTEERSIDRTIESSRTIDSGFRQAVDYIEKFRSTHARLPNSSEFSDWSLQYPDRVDTPRHFELETRIDCFPKALTAKFGPAPDGSYLVGYWRGEWMEYFASWTNKSTLSFDRRRYLLFWKRLLGRYVRVHFGSTVHDFGE